MGSESWENWGFVGECGECSVLVGWRVGDKWVGSGSGVGEGILGVGRGKWCVFVTDPFPKKQQLNKKMEFIPRIYRCYNIHYRNVSFFCYPFFAYDASCEK